MFGLTYGMVQMCFAKKEYSVALVGLSSVGKTVSFPCIIGNLQTLAEKVKCSYNGGTMKKIIPTVGLNGKNLLCHILTSVIRVELPTIKLRLWDLSGEVGMRKIWPNYTHDADAILFIVDSSNKVTLSECKDVFGLGHFAFV